MKNLDFQIADDAAEYLRKYILRSDTGESLVLTIVPVTESKRLDNIDSKPSDDAVAALANEYLESLSRPIELEWVVGGSLRSDLPATETMLINGIECFFPSDIRSVINGRVLRLRRGELVFDPELDPPISPDLAT